MAQGFKVMTFNVRGLRDKNKRRSIFSHLHDRYPDSIVVMQETHSASEFENSWSNEWGEGGIILAHGVSPHQGGVGIFFPKQFKGQFDAIFCSDDGRIICAKLKCRGVEMMIIGVYGPAAQNINRKKTFLSRLQDILTLYALDDTILLGDFNINMENEKNDASRALEKMLVDFAFRDVWKQTQGNKEGFNIGKKTVF